MNNDTTVLKLLIIQKKNNPLFGYIKKTLYVCKTHFKIKI
ncbi:hypothetical protein BFO_0348 [Tannerella forsythia 92A2]|uniref:Uncharacterized protein n=1 Tax=Tannerella forsythia (strain ATCC 43037 / JCM 10827 / CCUG 21028 A / KCTC 5666 / FDC 338) TaxID=203275 RepID=G8UK44_TANFA|nr:hypothetical protein BFO_0348 [Tannerella forsythia 92A2]